MKALAIARVNLVRFLRDRSNVVPMLLVPLVFVYLIGTQFGGEDRPVIGLHGSDALADQVEDDLRADDAVAVDRHDDLHDLREAVGAGEVTLGAALPTDAAELVSAGTGLEIEVLSRPEGGGAALAPVLSGVVAEHALIPGVVADLARDPSGVPADRARPAVEAVAAELTRTSVSASTPDGVELAAPGGRFAEGAAQQLVLMVFLFTLFSAMPMVQSRQLGLTRRMLGGPTRVSTVLAGEAGGRWLIALLQGAWILVVTAVVFDVDWGDLPAALAIVVVFGAVGAGAGLLVGALLDDDGAVLGAAMVLGLAVAALGGAMVPGELMSGLAATVSRFTPHAWALDAFAEVRAGAGLTDIVGELAVLAATAVVLVLVASWRLRVTLTR